MLSIKQLPDLLYPLAQRAQLGAAPSVKGFRDRYAEFVLGKFVSLSQHPALSKRECFMQNARVQCCHWIDHQLMQFFTAQPLAEGIEVDGGISTRFHRISQQMDWPLFSWTAVNTEEINHHLKTIFPLIDNFRYLDKLSHADAKATDFSWLLHFTTSNKQPCIFILGELGPIAKLNIWQDFLQTLAIANLLENTHVHVIVSHKLPSLCDATGALTCEILADYCAPTPPSPIFHRAKTWLGFSALKISTHFLRISKTNKAS